MTEKTVDDVLVHYGILGMKWGVRKERPVSASGYAGSGTVRVANAKNDKQGSVLANLVGNAHNFQSAEEKAESIAEYKKLISKYDSNRFNDDEYYSKYRKEAREVFEKQLNKKLPEGLIGKVYGSPDLDGPSYILVGNKKGLEQEEKKLLKDGFRHSEDSIEVILLTLNEVLDSEGYVIDATLGEEVKHSDEVNDFLAHYGVLGMKWGVRKDRRGSVTPGRFGKSRSTPKKETSNPRPAWQKAPVRAAKALKPKSELSEDARIFRELRERAQKKGISSLSNDEIRVLTNRARTLEEYNRSFPSNKKKTKSQKVKELIVKDLIEDVLFVTGKQLAKDAVKFRGQEELIKRGKLAPRKEDKEK